MRGIVGAVARRPPSLAAACLIACLLWLDSPSFESPSEPPPPPIRAALDAPLEEPKQAETSEPIAEPSAQDEQSAIEVTVISPSGAKVGGATVLAVGVGMWPARKTETGPDGNARIAGLEPGVYDLRAVHGDDVVRAPVTIVLSRDSTEKSTLRLVKGRHLKVRVVDGESDRPVPVPSASVVLAENGLSPFPLEAVTDKDGLAVLGPIAPTMATVSARAEGFVPRTGVMVKASGPAEVDVALVRGGMLVGEVVDARGRAIEGARIEVVGTDLSGSPIAETSETLAFRAAHFTFALAGPRPLLAAGELGVLPGRVPDIPRGPGLIPPVTPSVAGASPWVTRDDGTFRASPVSPGRLRVIARHPQFVEAISETLRMKPGEEARVKLVMREGGRLEGRVVDDRGEPIARARVDVVALRGTLAETLMTADDGTFTLAAVPERLAVTVTRPGVQDVTSHREQVNVKEGERKQLEIKLPPLREPILVRVTDPQRRPLPHAQVSVASLSPKAQLRRTRFTGDSGEVEFADARGLPVRIEVTLPGRAPVVMDLDAAPAEIALELSRGLTVTGLVTTRRGHDPLPGASVTLQMKAAVRHAQTDARGAFRLNDAAAGPARIVVTHPGHVSREREVTIEAPSHEQDFEVEAIDLAEAGSVEGEVVDAQGQPIAGARVAKDSVPTHLPGGRAPQGMAVTDRQGRFHLEDLPEGDVTLEAYSAEHGRGRLEVKVRAGRTTDRAKVVLEGTSKPTADESTSPGGLAVTLGERDVDEGVHVIVVLVTAGSEAERAGLLRGDRLVSIDGEAPTSMRDARSRLSGPLGEDVILEVERESDRHRLRVTREQVER